MSKQAINPNSEFANYPDIRYSTGQVQIITANNGFATYESSEFRVALSVESGHLFERIVMVIERKSDKMKTTQIVESACISNYKSPIHLFNQMLFNGVFQLNVTEKLQKSKKNSANDCAILIVLLILFFVFPFWIWGLVFVAILILGILANS